MDAEDSTALIMGDGKATRVEGCEKTLQSGYTYCRVREGAVAESSVFLITPITQCQRETCRFYEVYNQRGEMVKGGKFPNDQTRVEIKWKELLKRDTFEKGDRGFWIFLVTQYFNALIVTEDGDEVVEEHKTVIDGEIRLRVYSAGYRSLRSAKDNPNFVYEWLEDGLELKQTSSGRTYIGDQE